MEGWCKIKEAARYSGISQRTMRAWLKSGLRHVRLNTGTVLIKFGWIDEYLELFEVQGSAVDKILNEIKI